MARTHEAVCKLCRREGMKLFLKGQRCFSDKCAISRRDYPPGAHSYRRGKISEYGIQLREKQKLKRIYGMLEAPFRRVFAEAERLPGNTGEHLLALLERRVDNVVLACGFALSRNHARQMIVHGHFTVNGSRMRSPSAVVRVGDAIAPGSREAIQKVVREAVEVNKAQPVPAWLQVDREGLKGSVVALPRREDVPHPIQEQLIVEICSR
ncbi:MAG: 30S ribosomal protein S4 [Planctomycetota bacterium]